MVTPSPHLQRRQRSPAGKVFASVLLCKEDCVHWLSSKGPKPLMKDTMPNCWGSYKKIPRSNAPENWWMRSSFVRTMLQYTGLIPVAAVHDWLWTGWPSSLFAWSGIWLIFFKEENTVGWEPALQWCWGHICCWWLFWPLRWKLLNQEDASTTKLLEEVCGLHWRLWINLIWPHFTQYLCQPINFSTHPCITKSFEEHC